MTTFAGPVPARGDEMQNGNGHAAHEDPPESTWRGRDLRDPAAMREALVEIDARTDEALRGGRQFHAELRAMRGEQAEYQGVVLASLARIEHTTTTTKALAEETAMRVAVLAADADATDRDLATAKKAIADLHKAVAARGAGYSARDAAALARLEAKVESLEKRSDKIEADVDDTQRRNVIDLAEARAKLASVTDERDEKREAAREKREDRRHVVRWALGLVGALLMLVASAYVGARIGAPAHPQIPAPVVAH